jgi:hypothetical protein
LGCTGLYTIFAASALSAASSDALPVLPHRVQLEPFVRCASRIENHFYQFINQVTAKNLYYQSKAKTI